MDRRFQFTLRSLLIATTLLSCLAFVAYKITRPVEYRRPVSLRWSVLQGDLAGMKLAIDAGESVKRRDGAGDTYLHIAAKRGYPTVCESLIKLGLDVDETNSYGRTPLHMVTFELLSPHTPLRGHEQVIKVLLEAGAGSGARDNEGNTPEQLARLLGHANLAELITSHPGKKPACATKNEDGTQSPDDIINLLLEKE